MGELLQKFPHTPSKLSNKKDKKNNSKEADRRTAQAIQLALAHANGQGPPRPCPLGE